MGATREVGLVVGRSTNFDTALRIVRVMRRAAGGDEDSDPYILALRAASPDDVRAAIRLACAGDGKAVSV